MAAHRCIALAGCADWPAGHGDDRGVVEALAARGVEARWVVWDDPGVDWSAFEAVVIRQTWDYPSKLDAFLAWVDMVAAVSRLVNPAPVVRWNHDKRYLLELRDRGVPIVPTEVVTTGRTVSGHGPEVVVKPAVGVGGDGTIRLQNEPGRPPAALPAQPFDVLVQPFMASIETSGETSVILLGGDVSHTVCKRPAAGEFRVHEHRGGTYQPVEPTPAQRAVALSALAAARGTTGAEITYARADLVAGDDGEPLLMELELIEPSLYLHHAPAGAETLARALA